MDLYNHGIYELFIALITNDKVREIEYAKL